MTTDSARGATPDALGQGPAAEPTVRLRSAGFSLVRDCLRIQDKCAPRSFLRRVFGAHPIAPDAHFAYHGALGEVAVAALLTELGPGWFVQHEVPIGAAGSTVHHLLIGPPGVFAITLSNHTGREVWVSGQVFLTGPDSSPQIRDAESAANVAAALLSDAVGCAVEVTPCVVVLDSRSMVVAEPPRRVAVLSAGQLKPWLAALPAVLSPHEVALLGMYSEERSTWREPAHRPEDVRSLVHRFRQLQDEVGVARRRRLLWTTGGIIVAWCAFLATLGGAAAGLVSLLP